MRFDDNFIEQVRSSVSIVDLVSHYVSLKKSGQNHSGLCPFHNERTPSFLVSESKQIFKCFGCGEGGDAFKFLMLVEGLSFPDAIEQLAERCGIPLPRQTPGDDRRTDQRRRLLEVMDRAADQFRRWLHEPEGRGALDYLLNRGTDARTIQALGLGYAPLGNRLRLALRREGVTDPELAACGLAKESERGERYDRFRNRVMFPIRDLTGKTIAFGGRILDDGQPKYLNSPETPLYNKSSHLYGLDLSREEIRRRGFAILVEGYFDFLSPYQYGFPNVVASLGTSLTEPQVRLLGRYTRHVIINYDPDTAGMTAANRSIELFLRHSFRVNIVQLPEGLDPDSFLRRQGVEAYQERLKASQPFMDFSLARLIAAQRDPESPRGRQEIVNGILPLLLIVPDKIERSLYVSRISSRIGVEERLIRAELRQMSRRSRERSRPAEFLMRHEATPSERVLLAAVLDPTIAKRFLPLLEIELFEGLATQSIFEKVLELRELKREISILALRDMLEKRHDLHLVEEVGFQTTELLSEEGARESIRALQKKQDERLSRKIQEELTKAGDAGDPSERVRELIARKEALVKRKMELDLA